MNYTKLRGCRDHMVVGFTTTYTINAVGNPIINQFWDLGIKYTDRKTINSNNSVKFEVN
jgi:hypothetical protein